MPHPPPGPQTPGTLWSLTRALAPSLCSRPTSGPVKRLWDSALPYCPPAQGRGTGSAKDSPAGRGHGSHPEVPLEAACGFLGTICQCPLRACPPLVGRPQTGVAGEKEKSHAGLLLPALPLPEWLTASFFVFCFFSWPNLGQKGNLGPRPGRNRGSRARPARAAREAVSEPATGVGGPRARFAGSASIHNGVIAVFQRKGLPDQELFSLNEGVRQLLKTELGSFFTEYLQNQLLTKGMVILRDKIRFYEEKHFLRRSRSGDVLAKNPVVRSKSYNTPLLNPVAEHEAEGAAAGGPGIRRHSVSEMTSCPEPQGFSDTPGQASPGALRSSVGPQSGPCPSRLYPPAQPPEPGPGMAHPSPPSSSPENLVDQILESVDSDSEGIFIDFGRGRGPGASEFEGAGGRRSIV
ncbi:proline-rich protein 5 isoform X2 [Mustela putorius furo]|uniref:Proline-rich protein 5 isoform X2 n=1 Tax=Mustela putorius furo TaxID=9669 RepID=A0A8U0NHU6_MUSPF|nr:proline-rich protein 5 isoform X2 [Mustela putorius furo]